MGIIDTQAMLIPNDCLIAMSRMADNSIDSLVTDPPYGWRFMGKAWDVFDINKMIESDQKRGPRLCSDGSIRQRNEESLMAGSYDQSLKGNLAFQAWTTEWAREAYRVLKPGAHMLVFCGSGSTGVAARQEGFHFIGIEKEQEYFQIAWRRITHVQGD